MNKDDKIKDLCSSVNNLCYMLLANRQLIFSGAGAGAVEILDEAVTDSRRKVKAYCYIAPDKKSGSSGSAVLDALNKRNESDMPDVSDVSAE